MVRARLSASSLEEQFVKRIQQDYDGGWVKEVVTRPIRQPYQRGPVPPWYHVALCQDGRRSLPRSCADSFRNNLNRLLREWNVGRVVRIDEFSFEGDHRQLDERHFARGL